MTEGSWLLVVGRYGDGDVVGYGDGSECAVYGNDAEGESDVTKGSGLLVVGAAVSKSGVDGGDVDVEGGLGPFVGPARGDTLCPRYILCI